MNKSVGKEIERKCLQLKDCDQALTLQRFFKCGPGEYGEGDRFLGIKVPKTREIVKETLKNGSGTLEEVDYLLSSRWHEIRLAGLFVLIKMFQTADKKEDKAEKKRIIDFYLNHLYCVNNWDLVDLSAPYLLGKMALEDDKSLEIIYQLAEDERLWHRRVGIVSTLALIRNGRLDEIYRIAKSQFKYRHDLIGKATGWMLREAGKRDERRLLKFIEDHENEMPRVTFRYATEIIKRKTRENF